MTRFEGLDNGTLVSDKHRLDTVCTVFQAAEYRGSYATLTKNAVKDAKRMQRRKRRP